MKMMSSWFLIFTFLLSACMPTPVPSPVTPNAGEWQTWVLDDVATVRPAAPPDPATTEGELDEVMALIANRDEADLQQIAYWDAGSPSYRWIEIAFAQNRATPGPGPRVFRMMSLLNVATYDALVAAWDAKYTYNRARPAQLSPGLSVLAQQTNSPSYPSEHAVVAGAASTILAYIYPDRAQEFYDQAQAAAESRVLAGAHFRSDVVAGLELGRQVAQQVIDRAKVDDALPAWDGVAPVGPSYWRGEKPAEPNAAKWQPWVLASPDAVRPGPPPAYDSPELAAELQEVKEFTRTVQTNLKGLWWQTPEGTFETWYTFVNLRMFEQGMDADPMAAARIYALMSVAQYDAVVACWDAKYTYWAARPVHLDPDVTTLFPTPNFPSYPSGHACASTAGAEVIAAQFPAYADTIRALAAESRESRMWAGIHFRHEMAVGREIGLAAAQQVLDWDHTSDSLTVHADHLSPQR